MRAAGGAACLAAPSVNAGGVAVHGADVVSVSVERVAVVHRTRARCACLIAREVCEETARSIFQFAC